MKNGVKSLDLVRYAETNGYERDGDKPMAWRYRDYVSRAFNENKPYDRFVQEQLAGDELPEADADAITATGFHRPVSGTTNRLTVNLPAMITWTTFLEPRETYFWLCPLVAPGAMITKSIRYPRRITIPCFLSSPTCPPTWKRKYQFG